MTHEFGRPPGEATPPATVPLFGTQGALSTFARRTAERQAAFFLPSLEPGMRVLDCGCGPGTITVGLARRVAPGEVVGIDREARAIEQARAHTAEQQVTNVRFEQADLLALPFPAASFDAAFLHAVLEHVPDPVAAIAAVRQVVRPGGVIGVRSPDIAAHIYYPDSLLDEVRLVFLQWRERRGGHLRVGRELRAILHTAGLQDVVAGMMVEPYGTAEQVQHRGQHTASLFRGPIGEEMVRLGVTDWVTVERLAAAWETWSDDPRAFYGDVWGEAIGRVTDTPEP
jgi:2-polyprenyl-3-methyl-5-hydroxy-6-metoxy-1,4-benzoquinol methylase